MTPDRMTWAHPDDVDPTPLGEGIALRRLWAHPDGAAAYVVDIARERAA